MKPWATLFATSALVYRAWSHKSLTMPAIAAAAVTGILHGLHPSPAPFLLLAVFFVAGNAVTKINTETQARRIAEVKARSAGRTGADPSSDKEENKENNEEKEQASTPSPRPPPRGVMQVIANSLVATTLIVIHNMRLMQSNVMPCFAWGRDPLMVGIVAHYAVTTADTFSSELGSLSTSPPRLLTSCLTRTVPRGTNGGVTVDGIAAGALGAFVVAFISLIVLPFCPVYPVNNNAFRPGLEGGFSWGKNEKVAWVVGIAIWGTLGSLLDSLFGAVMQASVVDKNTGEIIEGECGAKVPLTQQKSKEKAEGTASAPVEQDRKILVGFDILDNNQINLLTAGIMSIAAMPVSEYFWKITSP